MMMLQSGLPCIVLKTHKKLHISKSPGILSRITLCAAVCVGDILGSFFFPGYLCRLLLGALCFTVALWHLGTWQDLVIDRETCLVSLLTRNWYHCLFIEVPEQNIVRFPTSWVTCVIVSESKGIDIILDNGCNVPVAPDCKNKRRLQKLRKEISAFLQLEMEVDVPSFNLWHLDDFRGSGTLSREVVPVINESDSDTMEIFDTDFDNQSKL